MQRRHVIAITGGGLVILILLIPALIYGTVETIERFPVDLTENTILMTNTVVSATLTGLLLILYAMTTFALIQQSGIQEQQQELMESKYKPMIETVKFDEYSGIMGYKMRNIGNGPATNMTISIHMVVPELGIDVRTGPDELGFVSDLDTGKMPKEINNLSEFEAADVSSLVPGQIGTLVADVGFHGPIEALGIDENERRGGGFITT